MHLRGLLVLIALLPALLVPEGLKFCVCLRACIDEVRTTSTCCDESESEDASEPEHSAVVSARCTDCASIETAATDVREVTKLLVDFDALHLPMLALDPWNAAGPPAATHASRLYAERSRAPLVPRSLSLPLLI